MGDVIPFRAAKKASSDSSGSSKSTKSSKKSEGRGLCRSGFHKWEVAKDSPFDVKKGRLVSGYTCSRCGAVKNEAK